MLSTFIFNSSTIFLNGLAFLIFSLFTFYYFKVYGKKSQTTPKSDIAEEENTEEINRQLEAKVEKRTKELARTSELLKQEIEMRKSLQIETYEREKQLKLITDALPVAVLYIDSEKRLRFANRRYELMSGRSFEDVAGAYIMDFIVPEKKAFSASKINEVLSGETLHFEMDYNYKNSARVLDVIDVPDVDENGEVRGFISVITDITDHKQKEIDLRTAIDAAESSNRAKSAFLANMSHEIRTPLGAVLGFSELIINPKLSAADRASYVSAIKRNGELLSNIINDILDLSKVEAGKLEIEKKSVSLTEVLTDVSSLLRLQAEDKGILLSIASDGLVPMSIQTDSLRLRQILINIVGNAIKFTQRGSIDVKIKFLKSSAKQNNLLSITVSDTGTGIAPEESKKLFEPFTQADVSTKRKFGGTGLGLSLSKRLAQLLGGDLVLTKTELGKGSIFTITIAPGNVDDSIFEIIDSAAKPVVCSSADRPISPVKLENLKILLVEDARDNQLLISRLLRLAGAVVDTSDNGQEGMQKALKNQYDVILMDLQMPVMDGYEATCALRKEGYQKPIIALSAHAMKEERHRCLSTGFNEHLSKPIDRLSLLKSVSEFAAAH